MYLQAAQYTFSHTAEEHTLWHKELNIALCVFVLHAEELLMRTDCEFVDFLRELSRRVTDAV